MSNAYVRGWGSPGRPGTPQASEYRVQHIVRVVAGGVALNVRAEVARLFVGFCDELVATGYRLDGIADDWGYNNRNIRGYPADDTNLDHKSNHAWGLAIDINSSTNPMTQDGKAHTDMPVATVRHLAAKWGLEWGGDYSSRRRDPMHFEFIGRPGDETIYPLTNDKPAPQPEPTQEDDVLYVIIGYHGGSGRWFYFPHTHHKMLISDGAALAEGQNGKGYGGYVEMFEQDLRSIPYPDPNKSPAA